MLQEKKTSKKSNPLIPIKLSTKSGKLMFGIRWAC